MKHTFYTRVGKRVLDFVGAIFGLIVLSPVFLAIALLIKATSRGPVFFRQTRVGHLEKPFRIFKLRSMTGTASGRGALLTAATDPRVTPLGRWLRKSKLDELPQLINVLLGDMSLVGPRPEVPEYVAAYSEDQFQVFLAKPGITGLVAMNNIEEEVLLATQKDKDHFYRAVLLPAKLRLDILYVQDIRLVEDLRILLATLFKLFCRTDATTPLLLQNGQPEAGLKELQ